VEGDLSSVPLSEALLLLHSGKKSGQLSVEAEVPLVLRFHDGEVIGGGIYDWTGFEAITAFDLQNREGAYRFRPEAVVGEPEPLMPFDTLVTEWARLTDEWRRFLAEVGPPSRVYEAPRGQGIYQVFAEPLSVRGAARRWGVPLIIAMERVWHGLREGELVGLAQYRWYPMRIRHPLAWEPLDRHPFADVIRRLTGEKTLGELIREGLSEERVREFLIEELRTRRMRPKGRGALLRDLTWEKQYGLRI